MSFHFRAKALTAAALLTSCVIAASPAAAAGTDADKCAAAIAKAMAKCTKKVIGIHTSCYKSTGVDCASSDAKLASALADIQGGIADKCPNAVVEDAGYGSYTGLNLGRHFKDVCARQAQLVTDRTFARDGSLYGSASDDGQKCIITAAKEAGKYLSGSLGVLSKCVVDGCSFDFSTGDVNEKYAKALAKLDGKTECDFSALLGSTSSAYLGGVTTQIPTAIASPCDPIDGTRCAYPYPNDFFTTPDSSTPTGQRVFFGGKALPKTDSDVEVTPTRWNETDGFSIGAMGLFSNADIDLTVSGAAPITDVAASLEDDAPIFMIDATTGERQLIWVERDQRGLTAADQPIIIRMAKNLKESTRYIVAVRNMKDAAALPVSASADFALYRDATPTNVLPFEARRAHMEDVFDTLALHEVGFVRSELYLAWDFTTQSTKSTSGRLLAMRDDAFGIIGSASPAFTVDTITEPLDANIYRQIDGTFQVPLYLTTVVLAGVPTPGGRGSLLRVNANDADYIPQNQGDFFTARYRCIVPNSAQTTPARISLYGHGLLGSRNEVNAGNVRDMASEHNMIFCATDWTGFAGSDDQLTAVQVVQDFSFFPAFIDRQHQGILNMMFLGRLAKHASGLSSDNAFRFGGNSMIDTSDVFYDGNSQGGILGGVLAAFSQDVTRFSLGVPGINYSTLLNRSVDFDDPFYALLTQSYDASTDRNLLLSLAQSIWDRTDPNGHINHVLADPYENTPVKKILYQVAFGDHQVAPVTAEIAARSNGASIHTPVLSTPKNPDVTPYYGIPAIPAYPFDGSAMVVWDAGNPAPPLGNVPPPDVADTTGYPVCAQTSDGGDPHSCPRKDADARIQKSEFLKTDGAIVDVCGGAACIVTP
jgi:hypothetical protein